MSRSRSFLATAVLLLATAMTSHGLYHGYPAHSGLAIRASASDNFDNTGLLPTGAKALKQPKASSTTSPDDEDSDPNDDDGDDGPAETGTSTSFDLPDPTDTSTSTSFTFSDEESSSETETSTSTSSTSSTTTSDPLTTSTHRSPKHDTPTFEAEPETTPDPTPATTLVVGPAPTSRVVPSSIRSPTVSPSALGASNSNDVFWANKSAVGGTFGAVGVVAVGVFGVIIFGLVRKQRARDAAARDTIVWSDKPARPPSSGPYPQRGWHSPNQSVEALSIQSPMDAFVHSRDPFQTVNDGAMAYHARPFVNVAARNQTPSVYSQNMAGLGTARPLSPPEPRYTGYDAHASNTNVSPSSDGWLAPPALHSSALRPDSMDSFYGAYGTHATGQAL